MLLKLKQRRVFKHNTSNASSFHQQALQRKPNRNAAPTPKRVVRATKFIKKNSECMYMRDRCRGIAGYVRGNAKCRIANRGKGAKRYHAITGRSSATPASRSFCAAGRRHAKCAAARRTAKLMYNETTPRRTKICATRRRTTTNALDQHESATLIGIHASHLLRFHAVFMTSGACTRLRRQPPPHHILPTDTVNTML